MSVDLTVLSGFLSCFLLGPRAFYFGLYLMFKLFTGFYFRFHLISIVLHGFDNVLLDLIAFSV